MKIVVLSQALTPTAGGSAVSEASLCASLQKRHPVLVLCRAGALDSAFVRGFGLTDVKQVHPREVLRAWRDPRHWLVQALSDADILHVNGHWRWENALLARFAAKQGIPYLLQPRGMLWLGHRRPWVKKAFNHLLGFETVRGASRVIALSEFEKSQWTAYGVDPARCEVLPNGIWDSAPVSVGITTPRTGKKYFLYLGRLESRKNLLFLVNAFSRYVRDGGEADLVLMGPSERGYDRRLRRAIRRQGLTDRVRLEAPCYAEAKQTWMRDALAVVYPSLGEAFGRVPFETLAAGGVPVVPRESGSAEYLEPVLPFCLYPVGDGDALLAVLRTIEHGRVPDLAQRLERIRTSLGKELHWDAITERLLRLYARVREEKPAVSGSTWLEGVSGGLDPLGEQS